MTIRTKRIALGIVLSGFVLTSYQNCAKNGFEALKVETEDLPSLQVPPQWGVGLVDETGFILPGEIAGQRFSNYNDCRNHDGLVDACIFLKNPVYMKGSAFPDVLAYQTDLSSLQSFGVKLKNLNSSGTLTSTKNLAVYYTGDDNRRSPFYSPPAGDTNPIYNNPFQLSLNGGKKFQAYAEDGNSNATGSSLKSTAQIMAYYWIQYLIEELGRRTGISWTDGKIIRVDAFATDSRYGGGERRNAFYQGYYSASSSNTQAGAHEIVMGYAISDAGANRHEMALGAEVYLHEMGHGNLFQAAGGTIYQDSENSKYEVYITKCSGQTVPQTRILNDIQLGILKSDCGGTTNFEYSIRNTFCMSELGCIDAINEGQADFHYLMMFPNSTALGETFTNNISGLGNSPIYLPGPANGTQCGAINSAKPPTPRDVKAPVPGAGKARDYFVGSSLQYSAYNAGGAIVRCGMDVPGEIHGMGSLYAKILWDIYSRSANKRAFEKTFQRTLAQYTKSMTISTARSFLKSDDRTFENSVNGALIDQVFNEKGIP